MDDDNLKRILSQALAFARDPLKAERAVVVYEGSGVLNGFEAATLWVDGEISLSLMESLVEEGEPMVLMDAAEDHRTRNQTSAILSALRAVVYVPICNPAGHKSGFFYADHRGHAGALGPSQLSMAEHFISSQLLPQLHPALPDAAASDLDWDTLTQTRWL